MPEAVQPVADAFESGDFYVVLRPEGEEFAGDDFDDPEYYVHNVKGTILLRDLEGRDLSEVGIFALHHIDGDGLIAQRLSIEQAYDLKQETWDYYEDLVDHENPWYFNTAVLAALNCEDEVLPSGMLIISDLDVHPEFRGKGLGLRALKCIMTRFRAGTGIIAMRPFPLQYVRGIDEKRLEEWGLLQYRGSERACLMKLRAHFGQLGFKLIPGTDVMALDAISKWNDPELATP